MADRNVAVRLSANVAAYVAAMKTAEAATLHMAGVTQAQMTRVGASMQSVGRRMTTMVSLPIVAATGLAVKAAVDWESAWAGVTKTVDGTASQMADLEAGLRDMAKELPASHREIAAVAEAAGALGIATPDIEQFTRVMLDLGETTNLTADQAATSIAQIMNVMQTAGGDVDNFASSLVHLGNTGASTEDEILALAQRIAGAGDLIGLSEDEVLGFAAAMADVGINAELGGTAMQRVFLGMSKAVSEGGESLVEFAEVAGVSADQFAAAFAADPAAAVTMFFQGLQRLDEAGVNVSSTLDDMGFRGQLVQQVILRLMGAGDDLAATLDRSATAWTDNTALMTEAEKRYATAAAQFEIVRNKIVDLFIDLGGILLPIVSGIVDAIGSIAEGFQALPQPLQIAVGGFLALVAAVGPVMFVTGAVMKNLTSLVSVFGLTGGAATTAARSLGLLGIAVAGGIAIYGLFTAEQRTTAANTKAATAALEAQFPALLTAAIAAGRASGEIDAVAVANEALSLSLAEGNQQLADSAAQLNIGASQIIDVFALMSADGEGLVTTMDFLARSFGLNAEQADFVANSYGMLNSPVLALRESTREMGHELGITEAQFDALLPAMASFFDAADEQSMQQMARDFLNAQVEAHGYEESLVAAAEAQAGSNRQTGDALAVYRAYAQIVAAASDEELSAAGISEELAAAVAEVDAAVTNATSSMGDFQTKSELFAARVGMVGDKFKELEGKIAPAAGAIDGIIDKLKGSAKGLADIFGPDIGAMGAGFKDIGDEAGDAVDGVDDLAGSFGELEGVAGSTIDSMTLSAEAFDDAARAASNFGDELARLTGEAIGVADAEQELWETALGFNDALAAQDDELGQVNRSLDISTVEGNKNVQMYQDWRDEILNLAAARLEDGEAIETVAADVLFNTGVMRDNAVANDFAKAEFDQLLKSWGLTPEQVETAIVQAGMTTARQDIEDLLAKYDDIPPEVATEIEALLDQGQYDQARWLLDNLARTRFAQIIAQAQTYDAARRLASVAGAIRIATIVAQVARSAEGRYVEGPMLSTLGESGPEVVLPLTNPGRMTALLDDPRVSGPIMAALSGLGTMSDGNIGGGTVAVGGGGDTYVNATVNMPPGSDGDDVVRALLKWERRSGPIPIRTR